MSEKQIKIRKTRDKEYTHSSFESRSPRRLGSLSSVVSFPTKSFKEYIAKKKRNKLQQDIYRCAMYGTTKDVEKVMSLGDDIFQIDEYGRSTLHYACLAGNLGTTKFLFQKGVVVDLADQEGYTALHWVAICNLPYMVQFLTFGCNANIHCRDLQGNTPLHLACQRTQVNTITTLLRCGANPNLKNDNGLTPGHIIDEDCDPGLRKKVRTLLRTIKPSDIQGKLIHENTLGLQKLSMIKNTLSIRNIDC